MKVEGTTTIDVVTSVWGSTGREIREPRTIPFTVWWVRDAVVVTYPEGDGQPR